MDSLFFDTLGALIGLVTVLLLLSMIVTALVQATQAMLRLRGRNLLFGLAGVLREQVNMSPERAKVEARTILNANGAPVLRSFVDPLGSVGKLFGPQVSWLEPAELREILGGCTLNLTDDACQSVVERYKKLQKVFSKRFLRTIRIWTIVWALPVASYFQVSVPALLNDFLNSHELQSRMLGVASDTHAYTPLSHEQIAKRVLEQLAVSHPELMLTLETASSGEQSKESIANELAFLLREHPDNRSLISEYQHLLHQSYQEELDTAFNATGVAALNLAQLNIEPWRESWEFYVRGGVARWGNWVGVLMTMILLSFGAPFWFNVLRNMMNLRDTLKPPSEIVGK